MCVCLCVLIISPKLSVVLKHDGCVWLVYVSEQIIRWFFFFFTWWCDYTENVHITLPADNCVFLYII